MTLQYKRVMCRTEQELVEAEKLATDGWKVISSGFDYVLLEKEV